MGTINAIISIVIRLCLAAAATAASWWIAKRCVTRTRDGTLGVLVRLEQPRRTVRPGFSVVIPGIDRIVTYSSLPQPWTDVVGVHCAEAVPIRLRINLTWTITDAVAFHVHRASIAHDIATAVHHEVALMARCVGLEQIPDLQIHERSFSPALHGRLAYLGIGIDQVTFSEITMPSAFYNARGSITLAELRREALQLEAISQDAVRRIDTASAANELVSLHRIGMTVGDQALRIYEARTTREAAQTGRLTVVNAPAQIVQAASRPTPPPPPPPPSTVRLAATPVHPMPPTTGPEKHRRGRRSRSR